MSAESLPHELRAQVAAEVVRDQGGPLKGWQSALLDVDPEMLRALHAYRERFFRGGPLSPKLRHLIWAAADSVVTHILPEGIRSHVAQARAHGATVEELLEALTIASAVSSRGVALALPIVVEELERAGVVVPFADAETVAEASRRVEAVLGDLPEGLALDLRLAPAVVEAFVAFTDGPAAGRALDDRSRELITCAVASCPAIADDDLTRRHARRAIAAGATGEELVFAVRTSNGIGLHSMYFGGMELSAILESALAEASADAGSSRSA